MKKSVDFQIKGNSYKINFPNNGQLIDIELQKSLLSGGRYGNLLFQGTTNSKYALDMIDVEANLNVLLPKIKKDYNIDSLADLSLEDSLELRKEYKEQVEPFIKEWQDIINKIYLGEDEKEDENEK